MPVADASFTGTLAHKHAGTHACNAKQSPLFRIVLNDALEAKEQFVTPGHELGHIFAAISAVALYLAGTTTKAEA